MCCSTPTGGCSISRWCRGVLTCGPSVFREGVRPEHLFITEFHGRRTLALLTDAENRLYAVTMPGYGVRRVGTVEFDPRREAMSIVGTLLNWTVCVEGAAAERYYAVSADDLSQLDTLVFPLSDRHVPGLSFTSATDNYVRPRRARRPVGRSSLRAPLVSGARFRSGGGGCRAPGFRGGAEKIADFSFRSESVATFVPEIESKSYRKKKMKMKRIVWNMLGAAAVGLLAVGCEKESGSQGSGPDRVSPAVLAAFEALYPGAEQVRWEVKGDYAVANFYWSGVRAAGVAANRAAWFENGDGAWSMTETDIRFDQLPEAVKRAFAEGEYADWRVDEVDMLDRDGVEVIYVVEVERDGREMDLYYSADGVLVKSVADAGDDYDYGDFIPSRSLRRDRGLHREPLSRGARDRRGCGVRGYGGRTDRRRPRQARTLLRPQRRLAVHQDRAAPLGTAAGGDGCVGGLRLLRGEGLPARRCRSVRDGLPKGRSTVWNWSRAAAT